MTTTRDNGGSLARFKGIKPHPDRARGLQPTHPAAVEGRTLFPTRVKPVAEARHLLISGHNNAKIGRLVTKGPWAGMPIYTLTLEERATCPRTCAQWLSCYGNAMHFPKRWDHMDPAFLPTLEKEIETLAGEHPQGFVVRLHILGDFYSHDYVRFWASMVDDFEALHIWGYTAHREDEGDPSSRAIGAALRRISDAAFDQVAIRFSHVTPGHDRTIVVDEDPGLPDVIVCPAQLEKTTTCGTCGLCWAEPARAKTIAFLRHGLSGGRTPLVPADKHTPGIIRAPTPLPGGEPVKRPRGRPPKIRQWGHFEGTAAATLTTTPEERLSATPEDVRAEIERRYGATFKPRKDPV